VSGMPMYSFEIIRNGRKPIEVTVTEDGQKSVYYFGCYITDRQIDVVLLPRMVADRKSTNKRKRGARHAS
jgi:hypothetical protein